MVAVVTRRKLQVWLVIVGQGNSIALRRHERNGSYRHSRRSEVFRRGNQSRASIRGLFDCAAIRNQFSESEVQDLRLASRSDKDIPWLDIPVNHTFRMRRIERVGDLDADIEQLLESGRWRDKYRSSGSPSTSSMAMKYSPSTSPIS